MLLPDATTPGMLETVLWQSVTTHPAADCVEDFLACVKKKTGKAVSNIDKSRVHAFIATQKEPYFLVGQAVHAGYFPLSAPAFDELKTFIRGLVP